MPTSPSTSRRFALAALLFASTTAFAQLPIPSSNAKVRAALDILKTDNAWTLQQQVELTQIPVAAVQRIRTRR